MTQYYTPSSWFWIFVAFVICCALALNKQRSKPIVDAVQQASTKLIKVIDP